MIQDTLSNYPVSVKEEEGEELFCYEKLEFWIDKYGELANDYKGILGEEVVENCLSEILNNDDISVQFAVEYHPNGGKGFGADNFLCVKDIDDAAGTIEVKTYNWATPLHSGNLEENFFEKRILW